MYIFIRLGARRDTIYVLFTSWFFLVTVATLDVGDALSLNDRCWRYAKYSTLPVLSYTLSTVDDETSSGKFTSSSKNEFPRYVLVALLKMSSSIREIQ